ncbi:MAG: hypothetical protein V5A20_11050 [Salinibacter sp.]|uniref:pirin family protein n=1 Tax=Salinibacter sp. TaxID=2065818 RepID=UPI002FC274D4
MGPAWGPCVPGLAPDTPPTTAGVLFQPIYRPIAQPRTTEQPISSPLRLRPSEERGVQDLGWSTNYLTFSFAHYQLWLEPDRPDTDFAYHERTPPPGEQDGQFRLYVSPDGRGDSMPVNADAYVSAGAFSPGDRVSYDVPPDRGAWIQVVEGTVSVGPVTLRAGDGAGVTAAGAIDVLIERPSEILLVDVGLEAA